MHEAATEARAGREWAVHRVLRGPGLPLLAILAAGAALRLYGLGWDGGHWLHPDERQIYFVVLELAWPESVAQAQSPASPLNPGFFAYGSLPIYLLRLVAGLLAPLWPAVRDPGNLHLAGRLLAALLDLGTAGLAYRLATRLAPEQRPQGSGLLAAALVALAVVHLQAAHFYTADVLLTFLGMLSLNLACDVAAGKGRGAQVGLAVAIGLALATKVAGAPLLLLVPAATVLRARSPDHPDAGRGPLAGILAALFLSAVTFLAVQPYAVLDWRTFLADTVREAQIARGGLEVPYTLQYARAIPVLYTVWQVMLWGLGLPAGIAVWSGLAALVMRWLRRGAPADTLVLTWAMPYVLVTGLMYAKPLRYALPLVPVLCTVAASALGRALPRRPATLAGWSVAAGSLVYALLYARIYAAPHPWIAASAWIYSHVPAGSTLVVEDWDTALPLPLDGGGQSRRIEEYEVRVLPVYAEPDDVAKAQALAAELAQADYLIIASRRAYGALARLPDRYPVTGDYYRQLFGGQLGFAPAAEFSRGPAWLNPRVAPLPGAAPGWLIPDESFVVYDHPRALVWRNEARLPAGELLQRLTAGE